MLNHTVCRKRPLRTDHEVTVGRYWETMRSRGEHINKSLSYGLLLMAVGLLATCVYLLFN